MKKFLYTCTLILIVLLNPSTTYAGVESTTNNPAAIAVVNLSKPGRLPGSPFYFVERWKEGLELFFTFDKTKKSKLLSQIAKLRLEEFNALLEEGRSEEAKRILQDYTITKKAVADLIQSNPTEIDKKTSGEILADNLNEVSQLKVIEEKTPELTVQSAVNDLVDTVVQLTEMEIENQDHPISQDQPENNSQLKIPLGPVGLPVASQTKDPSEQPSQSENNPTSLDNNSKSQPSDRPYQGIIPDHQLYESTDSAQPEQSNVEGISIHKNISKQPHGIWERIYNFFKSLFRLN